MHRLTLQARISILFGSFATLLILLTGLIFSGFYYFISERDINDFLKQEAKELAKAHIVFESGEIFYKIDQEGETLSTDLRNHELSAIVFNQHLERVGTFGVYRSNFSKGETDQTLDTEQLLQSVIETKKPVLSHALLAPDRQYDLYTAPLIKDGATFGLIQVAKEATFTNKLVNLNMLILFLILPISILLSWLIGYFVVNLSFTPLNKLINYMQTIQFHRIPQKIKIEGNPNDEVMKLAETFNEMLDRLGEGMQNQKEFVANASHELKTPLMHAISSLDINLLNLKSRNYQEVKKETELVKEDLLGLSRTIDSLLTFSKTHETAQKPKEEALNLSEVAHEVLRRFQEEEKRKSLQVTLTGNHNLRVLFAKEHLVVLLSNLISNAIKYSRTRGQIKINWVASNQKAAISVQDEGPGINKEEKHRLFHRFFRGPGKKREAEGVGIGLALVKSICQLWNLKIDILSKTNEGTKITVSDFPLSQ